MHQAYAGRAADARRAADAMGGADAMSAADAAAGALTPEPETAQAETAQAVAEALTGRAPRTLLAADSFRVRAHSGRIAVRGFARHLERFSRDAREAWHERLLQQGVEVGAHAASAGRRIAAFLEQVPERLASGGEGFPRLELWAADQPSAAPAPQLELALRPLPALRESVELRSAPRGARPLAHRKGPNIEAYRALSRELAAEPLLLDASGRVLEGATTSLIWWDPATHRGAVSALHHRVPSVTEALLREGAQLDPRFATAERLAECEVWAVNALHGIRWVSRIDDMPCAPPDAQRLARFREMLDRRWETVTAPRAVR